VDFRGDYESYLVRMWREPVSAEGESNAGWHIEIEHIQSGVKSTFDQLDDLLTMLCEKRQILEVKKEVTKRI
jgi:hypothetical protein